MSLLLSFTPHTLRFRFEAGTSRGILTTKTTYILTVRDQEFPEIYGVGEAGPLKGLSVDDVPDFERTLTEIVRRFNSSAYAIEGWQIEDLLETFVPNEYPSIRCGLEMALLDFVNGGQRVYFENDFTRGIRSIGINGLIWMGSPEFMAEQIETKLAEGYTTLKMKVGAVDFEQECQLLEGIRKRFSKEEISLRVDANGAFSPAEASEKLRRLAAFDLHSIEQPLRAGQPEASAALVKNAPIDIALDEELIGIGSKAEKVHLLEQVRPPYIILKPTLLGGFSQTIEWIELAEERGIRWWITSALESNIGLNAIAQFTAQFNNELPQGLGTGQLYHNNFESNLVIENAQLKLVSGGRPF
jgi:O-succinylbenzoate synthase